MNITILGAGNGGTAMAADLTLKGHQVTLCKTSNHLHNESFEWLESNQGEICLKEKEEVRLAKLYCVTRELKEALTEDIQIIVLFIQTNYQERLIQKIIPFLHHGQTILLEPGYLGTMFFMKYCSHLDLAIVEAESSPMDCRLDTFGEVSVMFRNVRNPISVYPKIKEKKTLEQLKGLRYHFTLLHSPLEAALHNPNMIVHTIGAIMSIPRIEYSDGDYWMYKEVFTPSIWNLVNQLDREKLALLQMMHLPATTYVDACRYRNAEDVTRSARQVFNDFAQHDSIKGPEVSNSRYITEDVPQGLALMESLGESLQVDTPVCSALIELASACLNTDFRKTGRSVQDFQGELNKLLHDIHEITYHTS